MNDFSIPPKLGKRGYVERSVSPGKRSSGKEGLRGPPDDRVTLSQKSGNSRKALPAEIRQDLVNKFRRDLEKGTYEVKAGEIADKIVQKIREEKDRIIF